MKVVDHPYLAGVKCREDGAVWIPASGRAGCPHWTFGASMNRGYRVVCIQRKHCLVHRLICEAFHGVCPPDKCQADHINRDKSDNRSENLRWVTRSENQRNRAVCLEAMKDVVSVTVDRNAYYRALRANNPKYRERENAYSRTRYATDPEYRERKKARARTRRPRKEREMVQKIASI